MAIQTNDLLAGITQEIDKEVNDCLVRANVIWQRVSDGKGRIKKTGSVWLQTPLKLIPNQSQDFVAGVGAPISVTPSIQLQYMIHTWKYAYFSVNFTLQDYTQSGGETDQIDYMAEKITGATADFGRLMAASVFGSSTTNPLAFTGLADVVASSGTAYGGLLDTDYTAYGTDIFSPYISTATLPTYATINDMTNKIRARVKTSEYAASKMLGFMNDSVFSKIQQDCRSSQIFLDTQNLYSVGSDEGFKVNGVEYYIDTYSQGSNTVGSSDNYIYLLPADVFKFNYKYGFDSKSPFDGTVRIPTQFLDSHQKVIAGEFICTNRRLVAVCKTVSI